MCAVVGAVIAIIYVVSSASDGDGGPTLIAAPPPTQEEATEVPPPPEPTPTDAPAPTPVSTPTLTPSPTATPRPTFSPTATPVPTTAPVGAASTPTPVRVSVRDLPVMEPSVIEQHILRLLNQERAGAGLEELEWDSRLAAVAKRYSNEMAGAGTVGHRLDGQSARERIREAGYRCSQYGENVASRQVARKYGSRNGGPWEATAYDRTQEAMAEGLVRQWMNSTKGHREAILSPEYRSVGVGVDVVMEYWSNIGMRHPVVYAVVNFTTCT